MCSAVCATVLTKRLKKRYVEEIFLLGLLHNLGQIVFLVQKDTAKDYLRVLKLIEEDTLDFTTAEQKVFGFSHNLIGALVAKKWNFSPESCQVILHYRDQLNADKPEGELEEKTAIVKLADLMAHTAGVGNPQGYADQMEEMISTSLYLGFPSEGIADTIAQIVADTKAQFENERHIYE